MTRPQVVIDFPNAPSFYVMAVREFLQGPSRAEGLSAGVRQDAIHVGTNRVPGQALYRAKSRKGK